MYERYNLCMYDNVLSFESSSTKMVHMNFSTVKKIFHGNYESDMFVSRTRDFCLMYVKTKK